MPSSRTLCIVTLALFGMVGCHRTSTGSGGLISTTDRASSDARPHGVAWYPDSTAEAFDYAQQVHKPTFVYFGAVWCPPCKELKATVFRRRDFLDRLSFFVPVYLDGDAPDAQRWADDLQVTGYPTVLILRDDRSEIARVSGGMNLARYAEILELGTSGARPAKEILRSLDRGVAQLDANDCRVLAYNAWQLEDSWIFSEDHPGWLSRTADQLTRAATACPRDAAVERARLQIYSASALADAPATSPDVSTEALPSAIANVRSTLADPVLAIDVGDALQDLPKSFFAAVAHRTAGDAAEFTRLWASTMDALAADPRYSKAARLYAIHSKIVGIKTMTGTVPAAVAAEALQRIEHALAEEHEANARGSAVNAALNILDALGDDARSHAILETEIQTSTTPYYYMADLGELEEKLGHTDRALEWLARGYQTSVGQATRFQWGSAYARGLMRMRPDDEAIIRSTTVTVLGELEGSGRIYGRTRYGLTRLAVQLRRWNQAGKHETAIAVIRGRMEGICRGIASDDSAREACGNFLRAI